MNELTIFWNSEIETEPSLFISTHGGLGVANPRNMLMGDEALVNINAHYDIDERLIEVTNASGRYGPPPWCLLLIP